jgi:hypothetical protein
MPKIEYGYEPRQVIFFPPTDCSGLGGNPHFRAPAYDPVVATLQGIAPRRQP